MKKISPAIIILILLAYQVPGSAYTRIYLMSEAEVTGKNVYVSDICKMEGDSTNLISGLAIPPDLYSDNIIDNSELFDFLSRSIDRQLFIFGSGIKIKRCVKAEVAEPVKVLLIEKGKTVDLSIRKNGIIIEMKGRAMESGFGKDEIEFRLTTGKVVKGRIISEKRADVNL